MILVQVINIRVTHVKDFILNLRGTKNSDESSSIKYLRLVPLKHQIMTTRNSLCRSSKKDLPQSKDLIKLMQKRSFVHDLFPI